MSPMLLEPVDRLIGEVSVPGDKSISHRLLMLAALSEGTSLIEGLNKGEDVRNTLKIICSLGAETLQNKDDFLTIKGGQLRQAKNSLDVGNSGTGIRLFAGMLAGMPFSTILDGDASIRTRPMERIIDPLQKMGSCITSVNQDGLPPLKISGGNLQGIEYQTDIASAQVKSCIMFAALFADAPTTVVEKAPTRAHTEELFKKVGLGVKVENTRITVEPGKPQSFEHNVEGDPSQAAFWVVAATILSGSELTIKNIYKGPQRSGFLDVLLRMGANIKYSKESNDIFVTSSELSGTVVEEDEVPGLIDEIPILAVAAVCANGTTHFKGLSELRLKETDRLKTITSELSSMGANIEIIEDGLLIEGSHFNGGDVQSHGDHRIAMSCAIAALVSRKPTKIHGWECVDTSYPNFAADLIDLIE